LTQWILHLERALLFLIVLSILPVFAYRYPPASVTIDPSYSIRYASLFALTAYSSAPLSSLDIITADLLLVGLVGSYAVASGILLLLKSLTPKHKATIHEILRVTKGKLILFALGGTQVGYIIFSYLNGQYGSLYNMPSNLLFAFRIYDSIGLLLLPFTALAHLILFPISSRALTWFFALQGLPLELLYQEGAFRSHQPYQLTTIGVCIIVPLMLLEWFLISCLLVWTFSKARKWQTSRKKLADQTSSQI
jgi:hypothetical protein